VKSTAQKRAPQLSNLPKKILLAKPRGFCAGVDRAIDVVKIALENFGPPIYVRKEIVHNIHVVNELRDAGAVFVEELEEVPDSSIVIYSAHGIAPSVRDAAKLKKLKSIDATCPLVTKVHQEAIRFARDGHHIFLIGHSNHDEVIGTMGEAPEQITLVSSVEDVDALAADAYEKTAVITQTTLSVDDTKPILEALERKFPDLHFPPKDDICYATTNRQLAVKAISEEVDMVLVIGSQNSSNSQRLTEVSIAHGTKSFLIDDIYEINPEWFEGVDVVAITAGASAPEHLVKEAVDYFKSLGVEEISQFEHIKEEVHFALPKELRALSPA